MHQAVITTLSKHGVKIDKGLITPIEGPQYIYQEKEEVKEKEKEQEKDSAENFVVEFVPGAKPPVFEKLKTKAEIFEMIFTDDLYIETLAITHRGKDFQKAFDECYIHHSNAPNPPRELGEWKQKLNTWLINTKQNGISKGKEINGRRESFARRHGSGTGS